MPKQKPKKLGKNPIEAWSSARIRVSKETHWAFPAELAIKPHACQTGHMAFAGKSGIMRNYPELDLTRGIYTYIDFSPTFGHSGRWHVRCTRISRRGEKPGKETTMVIIAKFASMCSCEAIELATALNLGLVGGAT